MSFIARLMGDVVFLQSARRTLKMTTPIAKNPSRVFPHVIEELAARYGDAPALIGARQTLTFRGLSKRANQYARWALAQNLAKGETVCLLMPNRPEYMAVWIGITQAGGAVALLNTNLVGLSLAHCIDLVEPKHIIVAAEYMDVIGTIATQLKSKPKLWVYGPREGGERLDIAIEAFDEAPLESAERPALTIEDRALYIYTSGTTGMPKAANVNHYRVMLASHGFAGVMGTTPNDRMYDCLPMYHSAGGLAATGALLVNGGSVVIRERFSAREFWDDVVRNDCTLFQYIGELCRYLMHSPPSANETRHKLRLVCGNGLRPDIWEEFQARFHIPKILEFYAATEGNVSMFNFDGKPGAIGRLPWYVAHRFPTALVRFDVEAEQPVRNEKGFCIACAPNEVGEAIGKIINDAKQPGARFEGYARKTEDDKKILRNVFEKGDAWFRTGDLMRKDEGRLFLFRRPHRRYLPLEGRERVDLGSGGSHRPFSRRGRSQCLWRAGAGQRRPRRHGRAGGRGQARFCRLARASRAQPARLCAAGVYPHSRHHRGDFHLQTEEARSGEPRFRSQRDQRRHLFQRRRARRFRQARRRAACAHLRR